MINWATEPKLWPHLWKTRPQMFWYLYPSLKIFSAEVQKKWIPEFLPRGPFQQHPQFGWHLQKDGNDVVAIHFNSGVSIYGKSYMTNEELLQTGSVHYLALDEEPPEHLMPELVMRVAATQGYISAVFTPTLSQKYWHDVMEERGTSREKFKDAHKLTVSLYDSMVYEDGTPSDWTNERINQLKNSLPSDDEIQRRIYGRFVMSKVGLKYPSFSRERNVKRAGPVPSDWLWYVGMDSGSGGKGSGHPAAIAWIAVSPDYKQGRIVEVWKGTPDQVTSHDSFTTTGDILDRYLLMKGNREVISARYDFADADLGIIASRNGIYVEKANKNHELGEGLLNTLFKNEMLDIDDRPENECLIQELLTLRRDTDKRKAKDDTIDATRYGATAPPWDMSVITDKHIIKIEKADTRSHVQKIDDERRNAPEEKDELTIDQEMEALNELYG